MSGNKVRGRGNKRVVKRRNPIAHLRLPKSLERVVLQMTDDPAKVRVITRNNDPIVVVDGKVVGGWLDL